MQVRSLEKEDPLEKEMAVHSSILAWGLPWTEEAGGLQSVGSQESDTTKRLNQHKRLGRLQAASVSGLTRSSGPALSRRDGCLQGHCPRGLSVTGLCGHQRRTCWGVGLILPLATTFHCIPREGRRSQNLRVGMDR